MALDHLPAQAFFGGLAQANAQSNRQHYYNIFEEQMAVRNGDTLTFTGGSVTGKPVRGLKDSGPKTLRDELQAEVDEWLPSL